MTSIKRSRSSTSSVIASSIRRCSSVTRTERSSGRLTRSISSRSRASSVIASSVRRCSRVTRTERSSSRLE